MDLFTHAHWRRLAEVEQPYCISLYMPMHRAGRDARANPVALRNLINQAEQHLRDANIHSTKVHDLLAPAHELCNNGEFWSPLSDGLAVFVAEGLLEAFRVPINFGEQAVVQPGFYLKPLLPLLEANGTYWMLAVSLKEVRLFEGTQFSIDPVHLQSLPQDLLQAFTTDQYLAPEEFTTQGPSGPVAGGGEAYFHGQGTAASSQRQQGEIRNYFERINRGLHPVLSSDHAPLVFAGAEHLFPIFRDTCKYRGLVDTPVRLNAQHLDVRHLHDAAWKLVEPILREDQERRLALYFERVGTGMASNQWETVHAAAHQGAIDTLFLPRRQQAWGTLDCASGEVTLHEHHQEGDVDLLDHLARLTLLNRGDVYTLEAERMPPGAMVLATFRYPVSPALQPNESRAQA